VKRKTLYWMIIAISLCTMIFYLTSSSHGTFIATEHMFHKYNVFARKSAHILIFGLIAVAVQRTLKEKKFSYLIAWIFATTYGAFDEFHQMFVPNRTPLLSDVGLDSTGALIALVILFLLLNSFRCKELTFSKDQL